MTDISRRDLDEILSSTERLHRTLDNSRLLVTGGTGFFGRWLLESWVDATDLLGLERTAVVISRDVDRFRRVAPRLAAHRSIELVNGNVLDAQRAAGTFDACIHAATAASLELTRADPRLMFDTIVQGTANVLDLLRPSGAIPMLFVSSGAVYGVQDPSVSNIAEDATGGPDPLSVPAVYAEAKRAAEMLCSIESVHGVQPKIARCFAFVGPYLPLDAHFAIGNFIRDGLAGGPIVIEGDGTTVRSYMYTSDLVIWLWTILLAGETVRPYNVGSPVGLDLGTVATIVADRCDTNVVVRSSPAGGPQARYVPDVDRAATELDLVLNVPISDAVVRTLDWNRGGR